MDKKKIKPQSGFEPETSCLQGKRSNQLSYNGSYCFSHLSNKKIFIFFNIIKYIFIKL